MYIISLFSKLIAKVTYSNDSVLVTNRFVQLFYVGDTVRSLMTVGNVLYAIYSASVKAKTVAERLNSLCINAFYYTCRLCFMKFMCNVILLFYVD